MAALPGRRSRLRRAFPAGDDRSGSPAGRARPGMRRSGGRPDAHGDARHRRRDAGARRRHRAAADRGAGAAGDRRRRRSRHLAAGDRGAGGAARPRARQVDRDGLRRASAPTATAACRRMPSGGRETSGAGCRATCCEQGLARAYVQAGNRACARRAPRRRAHRARGPSRPVGGRRLSGRGRRSRPSSCCATGARFRWSKGRIARVAQVRGTIYLQLRRQSARVCRLAAARRSRPSRGLRRRSEGARGQSSCACGAGSSSATAPRSISRAPA